MEMAFLRDDRMVLEVVFSIEWCIRAVKKGTVHAPQHPTNYFVTQKTFLFPSMILATKLAVMAIIISQILCALF